MMKKSIIKLFCIILCLSLLPVQVSFAANVDANYFVNASFNGYATYSLPSDLTITSKLAWVEEYKDHEKGLVLSGENSVSTLDFDISGQKKFLVSFDMKAQTGCPKGSLYIVGSDAKKFELIKFDGNNHVKAFNGRHIGGYGEHTIYNTSVYVNLESGLCDVWFNGKKVMSSQKLTGLNVTTPSLLSFNIEHESASAILFDNINVTDATSPLDSYIVEEYNEDVEDEAINSDDLVFEANVGTAVLHNSDFEIPTTMAYSRGVHNIEIIEDDIGNHVMLFEKKDGDTDFHLNAHNLNTESDYVVFEFDMMVHDKDGYFNFMIRGDDGLEVSYIRLSQGGVLSLGSTDKLLDVGKWYRVGYVLDYFNREVTLYFNGEKLTTEPISDKLFRSGKATMCRFHGSRYTKAGTADTSKHFKIWFDNVRVYDGKEPVEDLGEVKKVIKLSNKTVFDTHSSFKRALKNYVTLHTRSGVVFDGTEKKIMLDPPHEENGVMMVNTAELSELLGVTNPFTEKYVEAVKFFKTGLGKQVYTDNTCLNGGMIIAGSNVYAAPKGAEDLQELNDFLWYLYPEAETVKTIYEKSENKGKHPRLQATDEDFARIREEVKTDPVKKRWADAVINEATAYINKPVVFYELRDGVRLLSVSREVDKKLYALSMAYQLTGEQKFVDRAYAELEAVCKFPDWHPGHALDTGEMAAGVAIAYDWLYNALTEEQRKVCEEGIYNNVLYDANVLYTTSKGAMSTLAIGESNWNCVISGGISLAAMAVMDVYPDIAYRILGDSVKAASNVMWRYAPEGAWYEGAGYWDYAVQYTVKMLSSMQTQFGTSMGLETATGLDKAAQYEMYIQSPNGVFNYSDCLDGTKVYSPEMIWLAENYGQKELAAEIVKKCQFSNGEDLALGLLWKDSNYVSEAGVKLPLDKIYEADGTVVMRDSWHDKEQNFVGVHAGPTITGHYHLDGGSFIYETEGVRWAIDLGQGNYNTGGYWNEAPGGTRWHTFRTRAEAHNTLIVNPDNLEDMVIDSNAPVTKYETKPRGGIVVVDTTELHRSGVSTSKRGFAFCDNRNSLVIRDEIKFNAQSTAYWFMLTKANVTIDGNSALLTQNGRTLKLDFVSDAKAEISVDKAKPLPTSPADPGGSVETANRIQIKFSGNGDANLTVKLSSLTYDGTSVEDWNKPIDTWSIPDGEVPVKPVIDKVKIGDREIEPQGYSVDFYYVEGSLPGVPEISAHDERYNIEIQKAATLNEVSKIIVTDKNDATNKAIYNVMLHAIPTPKAFDGMTSIPIVSVVASDEPQEANKAMNVIDNDLSTRWSSDVSGSYLLLDLATAQKVDNLAIAFASGNARQTRFEVSVSYDGSVYEPVFSGMSSGTTLEHEFIPLGGKTARYVKVTCDGNTSTASSQWNSVTECVITRNN